MRVTGGSSAPVVGIVGAGQLARMTLQAAISLDVPVALLAARADDGAAKVSPTVMVGSPDSLDALVAFVPRCDVLTFDHELVDVEQLRQLEAAGYRLYPSSFTVAIAQNKAEQRARFGALGLPVPANGATATGDDLVRFGAKHGWPVVAKAARGGYDGRGVWIVPDERAARALVDQTAAAGVSLLAEQHVAIERELAVLVARRPGGEAVAYPVVETVQRDGICHEVLAPARIAPELSAEAERLALRIASAVDVVGILAVELFVVGARLVVNEIATRPHNSGHFSIEGCQTSQFENHLRAILDWPLGLTGLVAPAAVMANVIAGPETRDPSANLPAALEVPGVRVHLYGKAPRPARKVGHVTALGEDLDAARERAMAAAAILRGSQP